MKAGYTILGGRLSPPFDLTIEGKLPVTMETVTGNIAAADELRLPSIHRDKIGRHLAVVAGGPSINDHVATLRDWPRDQDETPDVWAINGAHGWGQDNGISAVFLAIDPHPIVARWALGAKWALLASCCDPAAFEAAAHASVVAFNLGAGGTRGGSSTATMAPHLAASMGYSSVTLFGCESSYPAGATHAYMHEPRPDEMLIACNGGEYLTAPDYYMQARDLSTMIRELPGYVAEKSGGLLRAMISDPAPEVRWISQAMADGLTPIRDGKVPHCRIVRVRPKTPRHQLAAE